MLRLLIALVACGVARATVYYADDDGGYYADDGYDSYMSDWNKDWAMLSGRFHQPKCVDIPTNLSLCREIGYTQMRLPNLLDHDTIAEVTQQAKSWVPLLGIRCHPDTKLFLCSLFSPVCLERTIWPCRSLCEDVKNSCEGFMNKYGFPWPEMLRCDKFPLDNDLCIGLQNHNKPDDTVCEPCNKPETFEGILDNFCSADFVLRIKVEENVISAGEIKLTPHRKKRAYKKGSLTKRDMRALTLYIENGEHCECSTLDNNSKKLLVMGRKDSGKLVLTYVMEYNRNQNKDLKRALRAFRKNENICQDINVLTDDSKKPPTEVVTERNSTDSTVHQEEEEEPANVANVDETRKPPRRRKKGKGNRHAGNVDDTDGGREGNNRKGRRKGRKRNNRDDMENAMTREERRRRREERRQLRKLRQLRERRTLDFSVMDESPA